MSGTPFPGSRCRMPRKPWRLGRWRIPLHQVYSGWNTGNSLAYHRSSHGWVIGYFMLAVHLLGQVEVRDAQGREATDLLRRPKRIALLAYLAAASPRGFQRRDKLIGLFWAETTQDKARRALNQALFVLRSELGKDAIVSRGDGEVALNGEQADVDVLRFEQAISDGDVEAALIQYRGEFLEGLYLSDAPEFERWVDRERDRYRHEASKAALMLADRYEKEGRFLAAVERCRWVRSIAPTDEVAARRLLQLLDSHGDRATALREYEALAKILDEDYGLEPSPETRALVERIRSRETPVPLGSKDGEVAAGLGEEAEVVQRDAGSDTTVADETPIGQLSAALSDRYRIERKIDSGGMSVVYLAEDSKHGRKVAIKVLRQELAQSIAVERFLQEIQFGASLPHPNIVSLHDSGKANGCPYYVMPYFADGSLRDRLKRERQLPIEEAIQITLEVANALHAAHAKGVLHRDVKPANIMLEAGHAVVSDFGIARALTEAGGERLTAHGVALGTPGYMSPEQGSGDEDLDVRSDEYSLACVLYEMLAGEMVFDGPSARAIAAKHRNLSPPPVTTLRTSVPRSVERVISRALEKSPADRYATVADFAGELKRAWETRDEPEPGPGWWERVGSRMVPAVVVAALVLVAGLFGPRAVRTIWPPEVASPDTTLYTILPFSYQAGIDIRLGEEELLHDAITRWSGLTVVDPMGVVEAIAETGGASVTTARARQLAERFDAGRYIHGSMTSVGDSIRVRAGLYDTDTGAELARHAVRVRPELSGIGVLFEHLVDSLLFRGNPPSDAPAEATTRSLPARQAFDRGQMAMGVWDLPLADSAFTSATDFDPGYAQARMWVALVRAWSGADPASWNIPAQQAGLGREAMSARDRAVTTAVLAEASGDLVRACSLWEELTELDANDFVGWYGHAKCLHGDDAVVSDRASPSGWSFRTSWHRALIEFQRAFELHPPILTSFRDRSFASLRDIFMTGGNELRRGYAVGDTASFAAFPEWRADSLALIPYPWRRIEQGSVPSSGNDATRRLREIFRDVTIAWSTSSPGRSDATEGLAIALALLGDPSALDTLRRARMYATDGSEQYRIAALEVWLQLTFALPWDEPGINAARELADSLLEGWPSEVDPNLVAGLAALTGRAFLAARLAREPRRGAPAVPQLRNSAPALLVFAAIGGPEDSLAALEQQVLMDLQMVPQAERPRRRSEWLGRSASLAFPVYRFRSLPELAGEDDYLVNLQVALARGDTLALRAGLEETREMRGPSSMAMVTVDALYPEADLLFQIGQLNEAAAWLDPALHSLPQVAPHVLALPERAASLVRAMALRAIIAQRLKQYDVARRWARAVVALWSNADPFLQVLVAELREIGG